MIEDLSREVIKKLPKYITGESIEVVREKYNLSEIDKLASNENQLGTSPKALTAMMDSLTTVSQYPEGTGVYLRRKLAKQYNKMNNMNLDEDNFIITAGASGILNNIGSVFINPGDEIIYSELSYPAYAGITTRNEGVHVVVPINKETLHMDLDGMYNAITDKTKIIFICNPNNPTGTVVDCEKVKEFIEKVPKHVLVVVDEAYFEFITLPEYESMVSMVESNANVIVLRTFSKVYGLAGVRVGYGIMKKEIHDILQKAADYFCTNKIALDGAIAALDDEEFFNNTIKTVKEGREYLALEFARLGFTVWESQTNFIYTDTGMDTFLLAEKLKEYGIIIRGNFPFSRISIGTEYQNKKLIYALKDIIKNSSVPKIKKFKLNYT